MLRLAFIAILIAFRYTTIVAYPYVLEWDLSSHPSNGFKKRDELPPLPSITFTEKDGREAAEATTPVWLCKDIQDGRLKCSLPTSLRSFRDIN